MNEAFTVPVNGLAQGRTDFRWNAGKEFFAKFENPEILDADLVVDVAVEKTGRDVGMDCRMEGSVTVPCDRCLDELRLPVSAGFKLSVEFGPEPAGETSGMDGDCEIVRLGERDPVLDLGQIVYDYACLSLPARKVHKAGGCNPAAMKYLDSEKMQEQTGSETLTPFASLKELMEKKKQ